MPKLFQHKHLGYKENFFTPSMNFIIIFFLKLHYIYNHEICKNILFCQKLSLYKKGLKLITGIRKNMKNHLINLTDKKLLRKRFCIETIFGFFKNSMNLEHTRHRSPINFLVNLIAALTAYSLTKGKPKKLTISTSLIHS